MDEYQGFYEDRFVRNLARHSSLRKRIRKRVGQILDDPFPNGESHIQADRWIDGEKLLSLSDFVGRSRE